MPLAFSIHTVLHQVKEGLVNTNEISLTVFSKTKCNTTFNDLSYRCFAISLNVPRPPNAASQFNGMCITLRTTPFTRSLLVLTSIDEPK